MNNIKDMKNKILLIFITILLLFSVVYAANPSFISKLYMVESAAGGNFTGQLQLSADTSHNLYKIHPDGTSKQVAIGNQAVGTGDSPSFAGATIGSTSGYLYATNGVVSTPHTGTPSVSLGSDWTANGYAGASVSLVSGSNDRRGIIVLTKGAGQAQVETITINSNPAVNDTCKIPTTIASAFTTFIFISGASSSTNVQIGADTTITATNLAARINAISGTNTAWIATSNTNVVTLTQIVTSAIGNILRPSQTVGATLSFAITSQGSPNLADSGLSAAVGGSQRLANITFSSPYPTTPIIKTYTLSGALTSSGSSSSAPTNFTNLPISTSGGSLFYTGGVGVNTQATSTTTGFTLCKDFNSSGISPNSYFVYLYEVLE